MNFKKVFLFAIIYAFIFSPAFSYAEDPAPPEAPEASFIIRNGDSVIWQGSVLLPEEGSVDISDANGTAHSVNARSVLAVLHSIDEGSDAFSVSNLQYFDSFGSFYLKCLTAGGTEACDNWQYAVGSTTPSEAIDAKILAGGETVGIYFGQNHRLVLSSESIVAGSSVDVTAQKYNYTNNTWQPLTGVSVGVTLPNPADQWSPIVVSTTPVDGSGVANIILNDPNTYSLGIAEDFYFPVYALVVSPRPISSGGSSHHQSSSSDTTTTKIFSVPKALAYLESVQSNDGSFGGEDLYTDWAAVAIGAGGANGSLHDRLLDYFKSRSFASAIVSDNERHTMALLALGVNPYSANGVNYIKLITDKFDGAQFGDPNLVNDDIFALIPLESAGYGSSDENIVKDVEFILSKQKADGSFEESVDLTAAAVQALKPLESINGVSSGLKKSGSYLRDKEENDGGWGSVYSTSWVIQAMNVLGANWEKNSNSPMEYLNKTQRADGGMLSVSESLTNRIWATSYAIPATLEKPWSAILHSVPRPASVVEKPAAGEISNAAAPNTENKTITKNNSVPKNNQNNISKITPENLTGNAQESTGKGWSPNIIGGILVLVVLGATVLIKFVF